MLLPLLEGDEEEVGAAARDAEDGRRGLAKTETDRVRDDERPVDEAPEDACGVSWVDRLGLATFGRRSVKRRCDPRVVDAGNEWSPSCHVEKERNGWRSSCTEALVDSVLAGSGLALRVIHPGARCHGGSLALGAA